MWTFGLLGGRRVVPTGRQTRLAMRLLLLRLMLGTHLGYRVFLATELRFASVLAHLSTRSYSNRLLLSSLLFGFCSRLGWYKLHMFVSRCLLAHTGSTK